MQKSEQYLALPGECLGLLLPETSWILYGPIVQLLIVPAAVDACPGVVLCIHCDALYDCMHSKFGNLQPVLPSGHEQ